MPLNFPTMYWGPNATSTAWALGASAPPINGTAVAWSESLHLWVLVGSGIATSPDGVTWTLRTSPPGTGNPIRNVVWSPELGLFVFTCGNTTIGRSVDGVTWESITAPVANGWVGLCWSAERMLFVTTSQDGALNRVMTSPDGITWTGRITQETGDLISVTYGNGVFVAPEATGGRAVNISTDGITWTRNPGAAGDNGWTHVAFSPELSLFAAVGTAAAVQTSPDGVVWTRRLTPGINADPYGILWVSSWGKFMVTTISVSLGYTGMESSDGIVWTPETLPLGSWERLAYSPTLDIAIAAGTEGIMTATPG